MHSVWPAFLTAVGLTFLVSGAVSIYYKLQSSGDSNE